MSKNTSVDITDQVSKLKTRLLSRAPFLGYLLLNLQLVVSENVPIAGVQQDGHLFLNPEPFLKMTEQEQAFVLAHEVLHPAFLFWSRMRGRNPMKFNIAHDYAINAILDEWARNGNIPISPPQGVLLDRQYDGLSAEEIYDKLKPEKKSGKGGGQGQDPLGGDCKEGNGGKEGGSMDEDREKTLDWKGKIARAKQIQDAVMQGWGNCPAGLQKMVDDILEPKLEWWEILSRWVGENGPRKDYSYRRPGRRSGGVSAYESLEVFLPAIIPFGFCDVTILFDTSGSCWGDECMKDALGEIKGIVEDLELRTRVMCVDTEIQSDITTQSIDELLKNIKGGGGSDYTPAFDKLRKDGFEGVVVAITDGYITVPDSRPEHLRDTLWVIHRNGARPAKWGEAVFMDKVVSRKK